jgi:hypothetical protein
MSICHSRKWNQVLSEKIKVRCTDGLGYLDAISKKTPQNTSQTVSRVVIQPWLAGLERQHHLPSACSNRDTTLHNDREQKLTHEQDEIQALEATSEASVPDPCILTTCSNT